MKTFGEKLSKFIEETPISKTGLSKKSGVQRHMIYIDLNAEFIPIDRLIAYSKALDVNLKVVWDDLVVSYTKGQEKEKIFTDALFQPLKQDYDLNIYREMLKIKENEIKLLRNQLSRFEDSFPQV